MKSRWLATLVCLAALLLSCEMQKNGIKKNTFGKMADGKKVTLYTLENANKLQVSVMDYGATLVSIKMPDNMGQVSEITLGFDSLKQYLSDSPYFGATIGRYANRIGQGKFVLDGKEYQLAQNDGSNHLHGGVRGFDKVMWKAETSTKEGEQSVIFHYHSPDGEEGYPGDVDVTVSYILTDGNNLRILYRATTTKPTIINLTNHTYFNLKDAGRTDILDHILKINAEEYTPVDETLIPTGELAPVEGTPFDFRQPRPIGERINSDHEQIKIAGGYDHNYVIGTFVGGKRLAATVFEPTTGRVLNISSTEPGLQFYSGNFLSGLKGRNGDIYHKHAGFCLETQHFPDSPNKPQFPSVILRPGETFSSETILHFSLRFIGLTNQ